MYPTENKGSSPLLPFGRGKCGWAKRRCSVIPNYTLYLYFIDNYNLTLVQFQKTVKEHGFVASFLLQVVLQLLCKTD